MPSKLLTPSPIDSLARALRQCHLERQRVRCYASSVWQDLIKSQNAMPPSLIPTTEPSSEALPQSEQKDESFRRPARNFRPGTVNKRVVSLKKKEANMRTIAVYPKIRSSIKMCPDPVAKITQDQLAILDPTGQRERLFARNNPERVRPGDVVLVRLKSGDPFAGVVLNIRQIHSKIDWAICLRNHLTRVGVEMWYKIFSPNVEGIEIVQRKKKRARRNKLYYMRQPKHDMGSLEGIVRNYTLAKAGLVHTKKGKKGSKKR